MSRRLPLFITLIRLHALCTGLARGQTFYFSDGRKASMPEARIRGANIIVPLKTAGTEDGGAEITLPISKLSRIDWPAPAAVAEAETALKAGKPADALKKIDTVLLEQEIFRNVPGSWWSEGAVIKAVALARLGKDGEADVLLALMRQSKASPEDVSRVTIAIIDQLLAAGKTDDATARLEKFQETATDDSGLAAIAVTKGQILERSGHFEDALLSYLRVPVFYPSEDASMPAALLGTGRVYKKLGDDARATATFASLSTRFPNSPEAAQAPR